LIESLILEPEDQAQDPEGEADPAEDVQPSPVADPLPPPPDIPVEGIVPEAPDAPAGWRVDRFGARSVAAPPWSRRPPRCHPEVWVMTSRKDQQVLIDEWKAEDPFGFACKKRGGRPTSQIKKRKTVQEHIHRCDDFAEHSC
jgi:hypothetical protein